MEQTDSNTTAAAVPQSEIISANEGRTWEWFIEIMPESVVHFFDKDFYHNTVFEWTSALILILLSIIAGKIAYWFIGKYVKRLASRTKSKLDDILIDKLEEPIVFGIIIIGSWWGMEILTFPAGFQNFVNNMFHILVAIDVTWMLARTLDAILVEYLVPVVEKSDSDLDNQLMPILRKGMRSIIWVLGIIVGLNNAGYDVGALLAGVGIGGLAMAMAAKDFVANVFGGITVFIDKPFKLNERIQVNGLDGTITDIGLRSSRMTTLAGRVVTIPNKTFTETWVENVSMEPWRKETLKLGLTYDTTPDKIEKALGILNEIVDKMDEVENDRLISFNTFGDFALTITFIYYIKKGSDIMATQNRMHLEILRRFNAEKLDFAFPTQTVLAQVEKTN